jgi:ABC-2 type transport system ATP-binding protein
MVELTGADGPPAYELLEVKGLTKKYGRLAAVDNLSFSIQSGEILGLIGPNGSGKTTVFECLGGVLPADSLALLQGGQPVTSETRAKLLFYLPDGITPWPAQSVRWAIDFMVGLYQGRAELRDDVIARLELGELLARPMGKLSKGQLKRVLLGIGLLMPHALLVADEPFEGLDLRQTREIAQAFRHYVSQGKRTFLLSIHQIRDAARVCDRFVFLSGGKLCGQGTLNELSELAAQKRGSASGADLEEVFLALT